MSADLTVSKTSGLRAAVVGNDGRTTAMARCLEASPRIDFPVANLFAGLRQPPLAKIETALERAESARPDFVVIGPEEPLAHGIVDRFAERGIPSVGPVQALAALESSKAFTRDLLARHGIPGNPEYRVFTDMTGIATYLATLGEFVVKPDGLTGGKGVKVSGDHLHSVQDGVHYCEELFQAGQPRIVIEEKLDGEEFSLQSFCDGTHVADTVVVQDHKRAHEGDSGPNTGGMGTYTDADHLLPFLDQASLDAASAINAQVAAALHASTGRRYKGILFGGFMSTARGIRLLEYNARFGDPESLNVLSLLETDFADVCVDIINGTLDRVPIGFRRQATVCKYIVPTGYPDHPVSGVTVDMSAVPPESANLRIYRASVEERTEGLVLGGSRAIAFVGIGDTIADAYRHAEYAAAAVKGPVFYRHDIGTDALIQRRVAHMAALRSPAGA